MRVQAVRRLLGVLTLAPALGHAGPETAADVRSGPLEEIVVTATRRSEEISKVPISIVALDLGALESSGIKSITDLANWVPGIEFDKSAGFGPNTLTNIAIRGINSNIGTSTTGIYLDDVPLQTRIVALSYWGNPFPQLFDLQRVEVDRGPQGTLFGAGAEGGAVRFISPEPDLRKFSGFARGEVAFTEHGAPTYEAGLAAGGPVREDVVGIRASAWVRRDGGYVDRIDPLTGATAEANSNWARAIVSRVALGVQPTESLRITPSVFYQQVRNNDSGAWFEDLSNPGAGIFKNGRLLAQPAVETVWVPSLKIEGTLPGMTITSVTGFVHRYADLTDDATSYNGALFGPFLSYGNPKGPQYPQNHSDAGPVFLTTKVNLFTQEIRASSAATDSSLKWTAGVFYSNSSQTDTEDVTTPFYLVNFFGLPGSDPLFLSSITSRDSQVAGFGQMDYQFARHFTFTAGLRIAHSTAKFFQAQSGPIATPQFPTASGEQSQTPVIPKAELSWQVNPDSLLYASAAKGFRVGGANQPIPLLPTPTGCPLPHEPPPFSGDQLWSYELGSKNRFLENRLKVDASVFYVDWQKIQQQIYFTSCSFGFIANTGAATSKGFDLSLQAAVTRALTAGVAVSYTDAKITKTVSFDGALLVQSGDVVGTLPAVNSPWDLNGMLQYDFNLSQSNAFVRLDGTYHSRNNGPFNSMIPGTVLYRPDIPSNPGYSQLNGRFGLTWGAVDYAVYVRNLTDRHPALNRFVETLGLGIPTDTTLQPRTYGVSANYRF